jgi:hypothetical protein
MNMHMKTRVFWGTLLLLLINFTNLFAQGDTPCGGGDPDAAPCPLDTWVAGLAIAALVLATIHLYRKQKTQKAID